MIIYRGLLHILQIPKQNQQMKNIQVKYVNQRQKHLLINDQSKPLLQIWV